MEGVGAPERASIGGPNHKWWALGTVAIGTFMSTLDSSIVNIALPSILRDFRSDLATIEWVVLAYLLTITHGVLGSTIQVVIVGILTFLILTTGDLFKRKLVTLAGPALSDRKATLELLVHAPCHAI